MRNAWRATVIQVAQATGIGFDSLWRGDLFEFWALWQATETMKARGILEMATSIGLALAGEGAKDEAQRIQRAAAGNPGGRDLEAEDRVRRFMSED